MFWLYTVAHVTFNFLQSCFGTLIKMFNSLHSLIIDNFVLHSLIIDNFVSILNVEDLVNLHVEIHVQTSVHSVNYSRQRYMYILELLLQCLSSQFRTNSEHLHLVQLCFFSQLRSDFITWYTSISIFKICVGEFQPIIYATTCIILL